MQSKAAHRDLRMYMCIYVCMYMKRNHSAKPHMDEHMSRVEGGRGWGYMNIVPPSTDFRSHSLVAGSNSGLGILDESRV